MKAILEFNLPEDQEEYKRVNAASDLCAVLWDFDQWLRAEIKYSNDTADPKILEGYKRAREKLGEIMNLHSVFLEEMYS